jgi:hypothetical protein
VAFAVFDSEGFILHVHGVFTRIRSGAKRWLPTAARSDLQSSQRWQCALVFWLDLLGMAAAA